MSDARTVLEELVQATRAAECISGSATGNCRSLDGCEHPVCAVAAVLRALPQVEAVKAAIRGAVYGGSVSEAFSRSRQVLAAIAEFAALDGQQVLDTGTHGKVPLTHERRHKALPQSSGEVAAGGAHVGEGSLVGGGDSQEPRSDLAGHRGHAGSDEAGGATAVLQGTEGLTLQSERRFGTFAEVLIWATGAAFIFWVGVYVTLAVLGVMG